MKDYKELLVWQRSMELVEEVYRISRGFPSDERYGLTSQLRRAAVSIPSNIAEGHATRRTGSFIRHLSIAKGSLAEVETQLEIARRLGYVPGGAGIGTDELSRMLSGLLTRLADRAA